MFDTYVTIIGNVLTAPEWRRTKNTGSLVANFKVASTARRLDRESGQWVDGNSFRVRVNCWRKLAEGVSSSVATGDPVIVVGRMYTRDWTDENNNRRVGYELEAVAVGHDLSRGMGRFARNRPTLATSTVEDGQEAVRVGGQLTEAVPMDEAPARRDDRFFDELSDGLPESQASPPGRYDPFAGAGRGFRPVPGGVAGDDLHGSAGLGGTDGPGGDDLGDDGPDGDDLGDDGPGDDDLGGDDLGDGLGDDDLTGDGLDGDELSDGDLVDGGGAGMAGGRLDDSGAGKTRSGRRRRERQPVPV